MSLSRRYENIQNTINSLEEIVNVLKECNSDRSIPKHEIAKRLGVNELKLNRLLRSLFDGVPTNKLKQFDAYEDLYHAIQSPSHAILSQVFDVNNRLMVTFPDYDEQYFWEEWLPSVLTPRELKIISMYYLGIDKKWDDEDVGQITLQEVGDHEGLTRERVRQILIHAFRRIASNKKYLKLWYKDPVNQDNSVLDIYDELESIYDKSLKLSHQAELLKEKYKDMPEVLNKIEEQLNEINEIEVILPEKIAIPSKDTPIENMDLSVRSFNILKRAHVQTASDIAKIGVDKLKDLPNCGLKSIGEIVYKMRKLNPPIEIDEMHVYDRYVKYFESVG